ncbi:MAG: 6-hydroxymethylpterin diphosphokinase MptE-like protein [Clostridia bacterium]
MIKKKIKNNNYGRYFYYSVKKIQIMPKKLSFEFNKYRRKKGKLDKCFTRIKDFNNLHNGKRCFIVATGPSLNLSDLDLIKDEFSFSMNSIIKLFNKTMWRPTYYAIQDVKVFDKLKDEIDNLEMNVLAGDRIISKFKLPDKYILYPLNMYNTLFSPIINKFNPKFSDNSYICVEDGFTITYSLIQIAIYMGFREIYLLGVDCNYKNQGDNHVVSIGINQDKAEENNLRMLTSYKVAKDYANTHKISIVNCSRGGSLEIFERKKLEDVIG